MSVRGVAAGTIATGIVTLALCGSASAHLYWANEGLDSITRASNAGTITDQNFISGVGVATDPTGVAINGNHIYWSHDEGAGGSIGRANIDGSSPNATLIATSSDPAGVGLDAGLVYWTHVVAGVGRVGRAPLGGTPANQAFQTTGTSPCGVTANGDKTWWANQGAPGSVGSAHGNDTPNQDLVPGTFTSDPCGVAIAGQYLYWTNQGGESIGRAALDGSGANMDFIDTGTGSIPCGVAVDAQHIYWTDSGADTVGRVDLDGATNRNLTFVPDTGTGSLPCGIAVTPTQQATPATSDFASTPAGDQSDIQSFTIANTASSILDVTGVNLVGADPGQFQITGDGCTPNATSAGLNCFVNVQHSPTTEGAHSATLRVVSNASNSPTDITLTGTGTAPQPDPPVVPPDTTPPDTTITSGPSGKTKSRSATFAFGGDASFDCSLDGAPFESCTSPKTFAGLAKGAHTFEVRAVDAAGNADPTPAGRSWTVKKKKKKKK